MQHAQKLRPLDYETRVTFATSQLDLIDANRDFLDNLLFFDESYFHLNGHVNHQNFRYWNDVNPHWFHEEPLHSPRVN